MNKMAQTDQNFEISGKTLLAYTPVEDVKSITIPEGVETIENFKLQSRISLEEIKIPASVTTIVPGAFKVSSGQNIKRILVDANNPVYKDLDGVLYTKDMKTLVAVPNGYEAEQYTIPNEVEIVADYAFYLNHKIKRIVIPDNAAMIGKYALMGFEEEVVLPITVDQIGNGFYSNADIKKIEFVDNLDVELQKLPQGPPLKTRIQIVINEKLSKKLHKCLITRNDIDAYWATRIKSDDPTEMAYVLLFQKAKVWESWLDDYGTQAAEIVEKAVELLEGEQKVTANATKRLTAFAKKYADKIDSEILNNMIALLKEKGRQKAALDFENSADVKKVTAAESVHPIEEYVSAHIDQACKEFEAEVKNGIRYADGSGISSVNAVILIVSQYRKQWMKYKKDYSGFMSSVEALAEGWKLKKDPIADQVADALDQKDLIAFLKEQAYSVRYRKYIIAFVRYADQTEVKEFIKSIKAGKKDTGKERWWAQTAENALYLSDRMAAAEYMDENKLLSKYAKMRGLNENDYRDSCMAEDFGFNENGTIQFDIGNDIIELSITPETKIQLYDTAQKKVIEAFPRKSEDADKLRAEREHFNELKKDIEEFIEKRTVYFHALYLSGRKVSHDIWVEMFLNHPIVKVLARFLIWQDADGQLFTVTETGVVDVNGKPYTPNGDVGLAHILEMKETDVESWKAFMAESKREPLIAQVWEPVVIGDEQSLRQRYNGIFISNANRNAFKKAMKLHGVEVRSASQEGVYDSETGKYQFSNYGKMLIGEYVELSYMADKDTKDLMLGYLKKGKANIRVLNTVIYELDKICDSTQIAKGKTELAGTGGTQ